ncbi:MAG: PD-(D/E)XK nuclease family protein [Clostridia bacterium]|nr:PD-(D/E)XK nuclease family protein [Clostridia bacterium]
MSLNIILGKSNSGKSEYLMNRIMACEDKQAILFVPSSMRVTSEQEYLEYTKKKGIVDVTITSIERFVDRNVNKGELYKSKEFLPELAKKLLVRKVILENDELFEIFRKVKNNTNFIDRICSYIDSAKKQNLCSEEILNKYTEEDFLGKKLIEFGNIYKKVEEELKDRFVSSIDAIEYFIKDITSKDEIKSMEFFFDGYNNFSKVEFEYIKALLSTGANVYITLEIDLEKHIDGTTEIFTASYEALENLRFIAKEVGVNVNEINLKTTKDNRPEDLAYLAENIFNLSKNEYKKEVKNIQLVLKENTYNEIEYVAVDILSKVKEGYKYKDFVVYTNDILGYNINMHRIFAMYNIPVYFNVEQSINSNPFVIYITILLKIITEGLKKDITPIISLVKTGLIDIENINEFENYVREFGVAGYMLESKFTYNNKKETNHIYDLDVLNAMREKVLENILNLKNKLSRANNAKDITNSIYEYIKESSILEKYEEHLTIIKEESANEYNKQIQIVAKFYEIMDNIVLAYSDIDVKEYLELLEYGAKEQITDTIPEKIDQVYIADINKNRGNAKKIGYIIGAYDGGLPIVQNEDNIFSDVELKKLKDRGIDLKQSRIDRNNMQLFNIYQAINKIREKLIITVPSSGMTGGSLRPSTLIQTIKNILDIKLESIETRTDLSLHSNFMDLIKRISNIKEDTPKDELEMLYNEFLVYIEEEKYKKILEYSRKDKNLEPETLDLIYKNEINSSVSRLEQFKRCPFAYYTNYILNLKESKEYQVTNIDTGSLMHEALEEFSKYIISKNIQWQEIVLNEKIRNSCNKELDKIVEKIFEESYSKFLVSPKYVVLKNKIKQSMKKTIYAIADSFNHSSFRPLGYEIAFEDGALFAPIKIELSSGKVLFLRGKIDRVDSAVINGATYLRIVDYKSSNKNLTLNDVKDGIMLQLMSYMWAMLENKEKVNKEGKVIPAAVSYFTISRNLLNISNYEADEEKISKGLKKALKLRGIYIRDIEVLEKLDNAVNDNNESYLELSKKALQDNNKTLPEEVFVEECNNMRKILEEISTDMVKGNVSICPNSKVRGVCDYCKFGTLCRKNILN